MSGTSEGDPNRAILVVDNLDPVRFLEVDHIGASVAEDHVRLVDAMTQDIVDVDLDVFLEPGHVARCGFRDAPAIENPAFVAVENVDEVALRHVFLAIFEGRLFVVYELREPVQIAGVAELAQLAGAGDVMDVQIRLAA